MPSVKIKSIMLNVIMLSVIMLECRYAECCGAFITSGIGGNVINIFTKPMKVRKNKLECSAPPDILSLASSFCEEDQWPGANVIELCTSVIYGCSK